MNIDKEETPSDAYPLIQKISTRPAQTGLNGSMDSSIEYSTYEPEEAAPAPQLAPAQIRVVSSTGIAATQELAFNPIPSQARVKRCSKCLIIWGWILIIFGAINIVCNAFSIV